ncbi:MAG: glycine cleavage system protein GcvH [Candidatus Marinimicrobia bacterium]|jgi:glycine cleavage system H protein|nr:glycine cleavage system protein GcvH [Candidatus Neomarinimicrobiota bacterium]MDP6592623.1 glycine cleavage system protein GcvH [Candidatus Neomarinimicrobiota bacterium]MDP6836469.1 glycine cleavage system protein GcvH [Candidatus Neomarinimicrobiota bacterium]|tara:strand:+ start:3089 stop:3466 length:378 start_codon:yes stop_codon:yes gene_type:complete
MNTPADLHYVDTHEWLSIDVLTATVGITDYAQRELGDIIFVELPEIGTEVKIGEPFAVIEAVKTVTDLFVPVSGTVAEINGSLEDSPEKINEDPYGEGWIVRIEMSDPSEGKSLLSADDYGKLIS